MMIDTAIAGESTCTCGSCMHVPGNATEIL